MTPWPSKHFTPDELRCRASGLLILHPGFLERLEALRIRYGRSMFVTSCCRSEEYNKKIKGHPLSLHICDRPQHRGQLGALAVDIAMIIGSERGNLFCAAWSLGWSVGWGNGFLHLDLRTLLGKEQTSFSY